MADAGGALLAAGVPLAQTENPSLLITVAAWGLVTVGLIVLVSAADRVPVGFRAELRRWFRLGLQPLFGVWNRLWPWNIYAFIASSGNGANTTHAYVLGLETPNSLDPFSVRCELRKKDLTFRSKEVNLASRPVRFWGRKLESRATYPDDFSYGSFPLSAGRWQVVWFSVQSDKRLKSGRIRISEWGGIEPSRVERLKRGVRSQPS